MTTAWLYRHLEQTGALGPDRIGRAVRATACRKCHAHTLTGLDGDLCAGVARVDPEPIDAIGEALALLTGRRTYCLHNSGDRYELQLRDQWKITGAPAGTRPYDVVAEHTCDAVNLPSRPSVYARPAAAYDDQPPY